MRKGRKVRVGASWVYKKKGSGQRLGWRMINGKWKKVKLTKKRSGKAPNFKGSWKHTTIHKWTNKKGGDGTATVKVSGYGPPSKPTGVNKAWAKKEGPKQIKDAITDAVARMAS